LFECAGAGVGAAGGGDAGSGPKRNFAITD